MPTASELFGFSIHPAEILLRGSAIYWFLFALFRFVLRRDTGSMAVSDILLVVLVADAAQNAMAGEYTSISDGCLLIAVLGGWNYALDWAAYHYEPMRRLVEGSPVLLVKDGKVLKRNMRREMVTMGELHSALREHGLEDVASVKLAMMEPDGDISIIKAETAQSDDDALQKARTPGAA